MTSSGMTSHGSIVMRLKMRVYIPLLAPNFPPKAAFSEVDVE